MRAVIQRVSSASVTVDGQAVSRGLLVLVGVGRDDSEDDVSKLTNKLLKLRLWPSLDGNSPWRLTVGEAGGQVLCVSQFTLYANVRKGAKPDFHAAAGGPVARELYERVADSLSKSLHEPGAVQRGVFGAMMDVALVNDGPVTIIFDTKE